MKASKNERSISQFDLKKPFLLGSVIFYCLVNFVLASFMFIKTKNSDEFVDMLLVFIVIEDIAVLLVCVMEYYFQSQKSTMEFFATLPFTGLKRRVNALVYDGLAFSVSYILSSIGIMIGMAIRYGVHTPTMKYGSLQLLVGYVFLLALLIMKNLFIVNCKNKITGIVLEVLLFLLVFYLLGLFLGLNMLACTIITMKKFYLEMGICLIAFVVLLILFLFSVSNLREENGTLFYHKTFKIGYFLLLGLLIVVSMVGEEIFIWWQSR